MALGKHYLKITDDFDARYIYNGLEFHYKDGSNTDIIEKKFKADDNHQGGEQKMEFINLQTKVKLKYFSSPREIPKQGLPKHTLEIEISGKKQSREDTIDKIKRITGGGISKYIVDSL